MLIKHYVDGRLMQSVPMTENSFCKVEKKGAGYTVIIDGRDIFYGNWRRHSLASVSEVLEDILTKFQYSAVTFDLMSHHYLTKP
jgi:hypothetical protein